MGCLAIFLLREALHEVELSSTTSTGNTITQCITPLAPFYAIVQQF